MENWDLRQAVGQFIEKISEWGDAKKFPCDSFDVKIFHKYARELDAEKKARVYQDKYFFGWGKNDRGPANGPRPVADLV